MPVAKPVPTSVRYLKARLKVLKRPMVWGSATVLGLAIFLLSEYWHNPAQFTQQTSDRPTPNSETPDALPSPAPLDPLATVDEGLPASEFDLLDSESQTESLPAFPAEAAAALNRLDDRLFTSLQTPQVNRENLTSQPASSSRNPFTASSAPSQSSLLDIPVLLNGAGTVPLLRDSGWETNSRTSPSPTSDQTGDRTATNPLQAALDRQSASGDVQASLSTPDNSSSSDATPPSTSLEESTADTISLSEQFYSPQPLPSQPSLHQTVPPPQFIPQTSPAPGTTGYTLPSVFQTPSPTDSPPSSLTRPIPGLQGLQFVSPAVPSFSTIQPNRSIPSYPSTIQPQVSRPQAAPAPFSIPRAAPGRYIGGGEINTFSNP